MLTHINPHDLYLVSIGGHYENLNDYPVYLCQLDHEWFKMMDKYRDELMPIFGSMRSKGMSLSSATIRGYRGIFIDGERVVFTDEAETESIVMMPHAPPPRDQREVWTYGSSLAEMLNVETYVLQGSDLLKVMGAELPFSNENGAVETECDSTVFHMFGIEELPKLNFYVRAGVDHTDVWIESESICYDDLRALYYGRAYETHLLKLREYKTIYYNYRSGEVWMSAAGCVAPDRVDGIVAGLKSEGKAVLIEAWKP
jgi:hypothetical protein